MTSEENRDSEHSNFQTPFTTQTNRWTEIRIICAIPEFIGVYE